MINIEKSLRLNEKDKWDECTLIKIFHIARMLVEDGRKFLAVKWLMNYRPLHHFITLSDVYPLVNMFEERNEYPE